MGISEYCRRRWDSPEGVAVGRSWESATFDVCIVCSGVLMGPGKHSRPEHEQIQPRFEHLFPPLAKDPAR